MNSVQLQGHWKQIKGTARVQWGRLTDDDLEQIAGRKDQLLGRIQQRYGITKETAEKQAEAWWTKVDRALSK